MPVLYKSMSTSVIRLNMNHDRTPARRTFRNAATLGLDEAIESGESPQGTCY